MLKFLKTLSKVLLDPTGRIRRKQFWIGWILLPIMVYSAYQQQNGSLLSLILGAFSIYISITLHGKRLHDFGRSYKLIIIPYAITIASYALMFFYMRSLLSSPTSFESIGHIDENIGHIEDVSVAFGVTNIVVWLTFAFYVGLPRGVIGDNIYGQDPKVDTVFSNTPGSQK